MELSASNQFNEILNLAKSLSLDEERQLKSEIEKDIEAKLVLSKSKKRVGAGSLRGFVTYMAPDFDAPIADFKEYM